MITNGFQGSVKSISRILVNVFRDHNVFEPILRDSIHSVEMLNKCNVLTRALAHGTNQEISGVGDVIRPRTFGNGHITTFSLQPIRMYLQC